MTFSFYRSVRRVFGMTLLVIGLSLALSPEILAEEAFEEKSREAEETVNNDHSQSAAGRSRGLDVAATSLGAAGGVVGGWCLGLMVGANSEAVLFSFSALGGVAGGYRGYKNGPILVSGGVLIFGGVTGVGFLLGIIDGDCGGPCQYLAFPGTLVAATAGGYLGYRIWRARESERNYAIIPTIAPNGSGLKFVGQF